MKKALITGGAGFIGFHLAEFLSENHEVILLDNFARSKKDTDLKKLLEKNNVSFIEADLTEKNQLSKLDSYDFVFHLAAINGTENFYSIPDKVIKVGVLGTINLLDWFVEQKKGKFLFSSSSETYAGTMKLLKENFPIPTPEDIPLTIDNPKNSRWSYGGSKIMSEITLHSYAKVYGFDYSIVRYHNIYGPRMGVQHVVPEFIKRILEKENPFTVFGGQETRTFCFIEDAVKATLIALNKGIKGETYHIGRSDEEIKIIDLAKKLFIIADARPEIKIKPAPEGSVKRRCPDISKISALGYKPEIKLDQGLKKTFEWYQEHLKK